MEKNKFYVPILKWKRGEQKALELLKTESLNKIIPLIEISPIDYDWINNVPKKSINEHVANIPATIINSIKDNQCFIDGFMLEDETLTNGDNPIKWIIETVRTSGGNPIPVTGTNRTTSYNNGITALLSNGTINEICIRLTEADFGTINAYLQDIIRNFDIAADKCHIVVDLKEIKAASVSTYILLLPILINNLIYLNSWASITLAATSFPATLSDVNRNSHSILPRSEYDLWTRLISIDNLSRTLNFGDYCISNPEYSEVDPRYINMSGNIRYTIDNGFLIYKGISTKINGFSQMINMCNLLINSLYYCGQTFSWGDDTIYRCANRTASTGNAETWRRIGTNHHIEFIINQLNNLTFFN